MSISCAWPKAPPCGWKFRCISTAGDVSPGLKKGGVLNIVRHSIGLICPADNIPNTIEVDVSGLDINESIHINALDPAGRREADHPRPRLHRLLHRGADQRDRRAARCCRRRRGRRLPRRACRRAAPAAGRRACRWRRSGCRCRRACRRRQAGCRSGQEVSRRRGRRLRHGHAASYCRPGQSWRRNMRGTGTMPASSSWTMLHAELRLRALEGQVRRPVVGRHAWRPQDLSAEAADLHEPFRRSASAPALRFFKLPLEALVVVHDEIDLAAGKLKVKTGGGDAGQNGLRSITATLGPDYRRVRLGIGHPGEKDQRQRPCAAEFQQGRHRLAEAAGGGDRRGRAAAGQGRRCRLHEQGGAAAQAAAKPKARKKEE